MALYAARRCASQRIRRLSSSLAVNQASRFDADTLHWRRIILLARYKFGDGHLLKSIRAGAGDEERGEAIEPARR